MSKRFNKLLSLALSFLIVLSVMCFNFFTPVKVNAVGPNLLVNAGFESGTTGWSGITGVYSISTADKHAGVNSLKVVGTASWTSAYQQISVTANTNYTYSAWIKGSGNIEMRVGNTAWTVLVAGSTITPTGTWTQYSLSFNSGSNTALIISFRDAAAGTKYIDDVYCGIDSGVTPTPTATPTATPVNNLLTNPGFENGTTGWSGITGVYSVSTADKHSGSYSLKEAGTASWTSAYQQISVTANTNYTYSAWIKGSGNIEMRVGNTAWSVLVAGSTITPTGTWTQYSLSFNSGSYTALIISVRDSAAGTIYIDDVSCGSGGPAPTPTPTPTPAGGLPAAIVGEWWWAWDPPTIATVRSEAPQVNFLSLAGAGVSGGGTGTVHTNFAVPGYTQSQMIADIDAWKASGRCVVGLVGGGGDTTVINNSTNVTQFMNSIIPIIDTYHLQGIDFDFENTPNAASIASCITQLKAHYGSNFIIAISPRPYELRSGGVYRSVIQQAGISNIDLVQPQTYALLGDSLAAQRSYMDADLSDWFGSGLIPASKLSVGSYFPGGEGLTESAQTCKDTYTYYKGVYPTLRGATNWETRDDRLNGWQFAIQLGSVVH